MSTPETSQPVKFRLGYSKLGKVRFLGHRDVARMWERTLRRAEVPVAMSSGFTPRARISFGLALPTGAESLIELLDVLVDRDRFSERGPEGEIENWADKTSRALPNGFALRHFDRTGSGTSLQESVTSSSWILLIAHPGTEDAVENLRSSSQVLLERERKGELQIDDIRPGILDIGVADGSQLASLVGVWPGDPMHDRSVTAVSALLTTAGRGIRPTELVKALFPAEEPWDLLTRVLRTNQWIDNDGQRVDALADSMAHPKVCA